MQPNKTENEYECFLCQDRGFIPQKDGTYIRCSCRLKKELLNYLDEYKDFKIKDTIKRNIDNYKTNLLFNGTDYNLFGSAVKTILAVTYLDNPKFEYQSITGNDLANGIFETDEWGSKVNNIYYDTDLLILKLGRDNINKALPDLMANLLTYRKEKKLATIVYIYKEAKEARLKQYYGDIAMSMINGFKEIKAKRSIV